MACVELSTGGAIVITFDGHVLCTARLLTRERKNSFSLMMRRVIPRLQRSNLQNNLT
jgi:hypothetical protein